MCGLVGFYTSTNASDEEIQMLKQLLLVDQIRGMHATGVAKVKIRENAVAIHKQAFDAVDYLASAETKEFLSKEKANIYIGHNRYATMGDKADHSNAHPFQEEHITLAHNGGVDQWGLDLLEGNTDPAVKVDSHMVTMTIAKHGIKKAVEEHLSGAFALVWWDSKERSLNFIRNSDRPLYMAVLTSGTLVWASEKGMLDVLFDRGGRATKYRLPPELIHTERHYKFQFNEHGVRQGQAPITEDMKFLDLALPKQMAAWFGGETTTSHSSRYPSARNSSVNSAASKSERINDLLIKRGLPFRHNSVVTCDVTRFEAYDSNPGFGRLFATERASGLEVEAWGIDSDDIVGIQVIRAVVGDVYEITRAATVSLAVSLDNVAVSCFDEKYDQKKDSYISTMKSSTKHVELAKSGDKVVELRPKRVPPLGEPVRYPLKTCGHTFQNSQVFVDFVSMGCSGCGKVPSAYDRRNHKLTVYEGKAFQGLLDDCEFLCGECAED